MIGQTISHFRILDQLGEGGMGVVYLAEDTNLGRRVAMKFLSTTTKEYRARFLREARAVSNLTHPNIATMFDYGETDEGQPFIVMELIKGQTLSEKLHEGSLPLPEAVRIVSAIAEALGEAHRQGVVHRDVKPSNVVINERGQVKVLDFGLAKQISEQHSLGVDHNQKTLPSTRTRSDVIVGTPLYLSPEQATGKTVDGRSDLFALGVVLYECITGQSAFAGGSVIEIGAQVIHITPTLPSKLNDCIPPELDRITMKAVEKKVEARYQSADELIEDLRLVLPNLADDGYRRGRSTESMQRAPTGSASALTTLIDQVKRPGPNRGVFILAILGAALLCYVIFRALQTGPIQPLPEAKTWYEQGVAALRDGAFLRATKAFEQSIASDPKYAMAHARLAEAWFEMDYADRAKDEMLKVHSLAPSRSDFTAGDGLHVDAINATVLRDFNGAIKAYLELVRLAPNEAQGYVDQGRAYEKNEETKKAIESYEKARQLDPQYATAFLRVGSLYGRQLDQANSFAAFDRAETIYQALGNFEGQAEVSFQRGVLFDQITKLDEARKHLGRALELAKTTNNDYLQVKTLQRLGNVEIAANNSAAGRQLMLDAIALAQAKGIDNLVKRGLVDLGNTFSADSNFVEAEKYMRQSLDLSLLQKDPRNAARARLALATIAEKQAHSDAVIALLEEALPFYQQGAYRKELLQALTLFGRAKVQKGDNEAAQKAFEQALSQAQQFDDEAQAGFAYQDLGFLAGRQGNYPQALSHAEEFYRISKSLKTPKNIGLALTDRATALSRMGRYDEAKLLLEEASAVAEDSKAAKNLAAGYHLLIARIALSELNFPEAITHSQQSLTLAGTQLRRTATTATFTEALARALSGKPSDRAKCEAALTVARQVADPTVLAESLLAMAQLQLQGRDAAGSLQSALEAQKMFEKAGHKDGEWLAWLVAARASRSLGDATKTREDAQQAEKVLNGIQVQWGADNFNSYLNRPDIKLLHTQLTQLTQLLAEKP